jgi:hypothetical protein
MMLSTNNLSTRNVSASLDSTNPASGISLLVENSELMGDQKDVQQFFMHKEKKAWDIFRLWHFLYYGEQSLVADLQAIPPMKSADISVKFLSVKPPLSDKERLEEMKLRKELGIATLKDLLKMDNPELSDEQLEVKLSELSEAKGKAEEEAAQLFAKATTKPIGVSDKPPQDLPEGDVEEDSQKTEK